MQLIINLVLLSLLYVAIYKDVKTGKIPNLINLGAMIIGLLLNIIYNGIDGFLFGIKGLLLGIGIFIVPFALGGIGAGDVKLIGAIGALKGPLFVFWTALFSAVSGGIIASLIMIKRRMFIKVCKSLFSGIYNLVMFKIPDVLKPEEKENTGFPYALAIGIGTLITLFLQIEGWIR